MLSMEVGRAKSSMIVVLPARYGLHRRIQVLGSLQNEGGSRQRWMYHGSRATICSVIGQNLSPQHSNTCKRFAYTP